MSLRKGKANSAKLPSTSGKEATIIKNRFKAFEEDDEPDEKHQLQHQPARPRFCVLESWQCQGHESTAL